MIRIDTSMSASPALPRSAGPFFAGTVLAAFSAGSARCHAQGAVLSAREEPVELSTFEVRGVVGEYNNVGGVRSEGVRTDNYREYQSGTGTLAPGATPPEPR